MTDKLPFMKLYPDDILGEVSLQMADNLTYRVWTTALFTSWNSPKRGVLEGTLEELSRLFSFATLDELSFAISEIERLNIGTVKRNGNGVVTLMSRRIVREERERELTRKRVAKHRDKPEGVTDEKRECNGDVTGHIPETRRQKTEKEESHVTFDEDSDPYKVALYLRSRLLAWKSNLNVPAATPKGLAAWSADIDKAIRINKRTPSDLIALVDWMHDKEQPSGDGFQWRDQILSGKKLREKFDKITISMDRKPPNEPDRSGEYELKI